MKIYISPIAKSIELYGESALLSGSNDPEVHNELGGAGQDSNRRQSIWGDED